VAELELAEGDEDGPTPAELLEQRLDEVEALIGLDLREALFENLTGAFARFVLSDRRAYAHAPGAPLAAVDALLAVGAVVLPQVGAVHVVGLRDGAAMEELIDALIGLSGADALVREEQVGEHWVQWLDLSRLPVDGIRPSWVVLDDALLFSGGLPSLRAALAQLAQDAPPSWLDDGERAARARALVEGGACMVAVADSAALFERRVVRPLREAEAALDTEALGKQLRPWLAGLVPARAGQEPRDPLEEARGWLRQGSAAGERLRDGALRGSWLSTLTWSGGRLSDRSWTEPAQRD
jgi:hypothetical protein